MYIGVTSRPVEQRWGKNGSQYTKNRNPCFYNAIIKYGWDNFEHKILFSDLSEIDAKSKEKELILKYHTCVYDENKNGYNMTFGGDGMQGYKPSKETLQKMSESHTGKNNSFYGKHHSDIQKKKWSEDRKNTRCGKENSFFGKHHTKETRQKLSEIASKRVGESNPNFNNHALAGKNHPMYGKHLSDETKAKISKSHIGVGKKVMCIETNKTYKTIKDAAVDMNLDAGSISRCCNGVYKSVKGYHFKLQPQGE